MVNGGNPNEPVTTNGSEQDHEVAPWFSDREQTNLLLLRVNRRPLPEPQLFSVQPEDVLDHISEVLMFGVEVESGRKQKRRWLLGNRDIDLARRTLAGRVGYQRERVEYEDTFDRESQEWTEDLRQDKVTAQAPFVFDASTRYLAVLQHPSFTPAQLASVFGQLLNKGESDRGFLASAEFRQRTPLLSYGAAQVRVEFAYRSFFGRTADSGGLSFWTNQLWSASNKEAKWDQILAGFSTSQEFVNRVVGAGWFMDGPICA